METMGNPYLVSFIERSIEDARAFQELLKVIDKMEYLRRELEINEAEIFLLSIRDNDRKEL